MKYQFQLSSGDFQLYIKEAYSFDYNLYPDFQPQNYYPYIPICLMFDIRDTQKNLPIGKVKLFGIHIFDRYERAL